MWDLLSQLFLLQKAVAHPLLSLKSRGRTVGQKCRDRRGRGRREMPQTHAVTTSTFGEFFLQNHASSSGLLVG